MALTEEEKTIIRGEIDSEYVGAGARIIAGKLNTDGSALTETWVDIAREEQKIDIRKSELLACLTDAEHDALIAYRESDAAGVKRFNEFYEASSYFTITHDKMREVLRQLNAGGILENDTLAVILRLGQRLKSRAEELVGRKVTVEEVQEVLHAH